MSALTRDIKQEAFRLGFDVVGIARVPPPPSSESRSLPVHPFPLHQRLYTALRRWLQQGYHGTMNWMNRNPEKRSNPAHVLPGCRSIISLGINYYTDSQSDERTGNGRIARYAWGEDYHRLFKQRLKSLEASLRLLAPKATMLSYVDTGPIMEKAWAQEAGLGWIGKHSNLVSPEFGSWLLLGEILTTLPLQPDEPETDACGSCTLCLQACPTGAIVEPYVVDAEQCISYLTIEFRGEAHAIPEDLRSKMGNRIFGCDDCLDICPYNMNATPTKELSFQPSPLTKGPSLRTLLTFTEDDFHRTFQRSPIRRAHYQGFLRNVKLAEQNGQATTLPSDSP